MSHNVLVVDDEPKLCDLLSSALSQNEIEVYTAGNGLQALAILEQEAIDLVISDWRMPGMDGPQLLAEVKLRYPHVPVIVMTAYSTVKNAVQSMRNGAYDYISKPFSLREVAARVKAVLRRTRQGETEHAPEQIVYKTLVLDIIKKKVCIDGEEAPLTKKEFEILLLLAQNAGIVFSKEQIYDCVWKEPYFGDYNIVMSHIRNLREKIEDNPSKPMYIQTVWGVGYRFNKNLSSGL